MSVRLAIIFMQEVIEIDMKLLPQTQGETVWHMSWQCSPAEGNASGPLRSSRFASQPNSLKNHSLTSRTRTASQSGTLILLLLPIKHRVAPPETCNLFSISSCHHKIVYLAKQIKGTNRGITRNTSQLSDKYAHVQYM